MRLAFLPWRALTKLSPPRAPPARSPASVLATVLNIKLLKLSNSALCPTSLKIACGSSVPRHAPRPSKLLPRSSLPAESPMRPQSFSTKNTRPDNSFCGAAARTRLRAYSLRCRRGRRPTRRDTYHLNSRVRIPLLFEYSTCFFSRHLFFFHSRPHHARGSTLSVLRSCRTIAPAAALFLCCCVSGVGCAVIAHGSFLSRALVLIIGVCTVLPSLMAPSFFFLQQVVFHQIF